ncbi:MAG: glycogen debranching protein [Acidobacteriota bacterium]|nr:glycogen debranching protein [Acidobacteriota bacterium]
MWKRQLLAPLLIATAVFAAGLEPLANFETGESTLQIVSPSIPTMSWTVAGEHGALFGRQNGKFEAWQWPVKILSDFHIRAELADYPVPIDVNALAAQIRVTPAETTITYSHAAFTVRQHMFAARGSIAPAAGTAVFFEIESARPLELTFSFTPDMLHMWPAPNHGRPNGEWVSRNGGFYILHTDDPKFSAVVAMPRARPGIQVPYQEHPQTYPLELKLSFDPKQDGGKVFPLVMALAQTDAPASQVAQTLAAIPEIYTTTQAYYNRFFDTRLTINTPDHRLNDALRWAEVAIDQAQVKYHDETGLVAGYYESADSARPGYAWFFGRDTLWTSYAISSYGDFALTRRALDFLFNRQREDGKIMHEYSQSADALDWKQTPYFYASADSTPLLVMAMWDYVRTSGDTGFLKQHWDAGLKAYRFTRAHEANDGIYANSEGTGWVESWPSGMPKEEFYEAAVDAQSASAMSHLAEVMSDAELMNAAKAKAAFIADKLESEFYAQGDKFYAFSRNPDNSLDDTATIYPAVAWWDGSLSLKSAGPMLSRWASHEFSSDWGTRDISERTPFYDPISYHQGSIWPLFTGWVSLAEYRAGRPLSGYAHLMQNAELTWAQDLGSVTELLSGQFYQPLGRSSSHQLWSSAMVISPLLRGLFGLDWDALHHTLHVAPHLPADWERASLHNVPLGSEKVDVEYRRIGDHMSVQVTGQRPLTVALDPVELAIPAELPSPGSETRQLKVLDETSAAHETTFLLEGWASAVYDFDIRLNRPHVSVQGGQLNGGKLHVQFPNGTGYRNQLLRFRY